MMPAMRWIGVGAAACAAAVMIGTAGCGSSSSTTDTKGTPSPSTSARPPAASVKATLAAEQDVFNAACVPASADCSPHLKDLVEAADKLRTAMHADSAGPAFFSDAYA